MKMNFSSILTVLAIMQSGYILAQTPAAPDYSNLDNWAASPYKMDASDKIPAGLDDEEADKKADVFFIHPTSYFGEADTSNCNSWLTYDAVIQ